MPASSIAMPSITKAQLSDTSSYVDSDAFLVFLLLGLNMACTNLSCNHFTAHEAHALLTAIIVIAMSNITWLVLSVDLQELCHGNIIISILNRGQIGHRNSGACKQPYSRPFLNFLWFLVYDGTLHKLHFEHSCILLMKPAKAMSFAVQFSRM